jgi:hypothetical protein
MKKLYSAIYRTVIYEEPSKIKDTAKRLHSDTMECDLDYLGEITDEEYLPKNWQGHFYPVVSANGALGTIAIRKLLNDSICDRLTEENAKLTDTVETLKAEVTKLKKSLEDTQEKEYENGYQAGLDAAYHSAQYRKD